ncbi:hypothetical protein FKG94_19485 [Exilibacterium tricleocarpae]|uniref:Transcriptional regulator SutA RNAP-binding domain-containing protein n=1 Tax=Exilibacterium tricleocarpae TaxID=2591008 RepID=A0A545T3Q8_9GAMM|nr:hypothetical protein [Exilibacterium tricleocarpae]TQV71828.1 hypothetical protein FKG94_19485 [Exilibacterium tricleocarpae]
MKPTKTKAQVRKEIGNQVRDFLAEGGKVEQLQPGVSGRDINQALPVTFNQPKVKRTPLLEEIKALDARKGKHQPKVLAPKKPVKKLLHDDFGEPVRWVWLED